MDFVALIFMTVTAAGIIIGAVIGYRLAAMNYQTTVDVYICAFIGMFAGAVLGLVLTAMAVNIPLIFIAFLIAVFIVVNMERNRAANALHPEPFEEEEEEEEEEEPSVSEYQNILKHYKR